MSIDRLASTMNPYQVSSQNNSTQRGQDFKALADALKSGDMAGAQQAFSDLQRIVKGASSNDQTQNGQQADSSNPLSADINALGKALQSGDLSAARAAFSKLSQDMQVSRRGHHHHQSATSGSQNSTSTASASSISPGATSKGASDNDQSSKGSLINVKA